MKEKLYLIFVLAVLVTSPSLGRVIFRPVNLQSQTSSTPSISIDIDLDGTVDFILQFEKQNVPASVPGNPTPYVCGSSPTIYLARHGFGDIIGITSIQTTNSYYAGTANPLPSNTVIGPNLTFSTLTSTTGNLRLVSRIEAGMYDNINQCYLSYNPYGPVGYSGAWNSTNFNGGYLGVKFMISGKIHFGYIKFDAKTYNSMFNDLGYTISEIAYESIPGFPITTGNKVGFMSEASNPTGNVIKGKVYFDNNSNCVFNNGETPIPYAIIYTAVGNYAGMSDAQGNYEIYVPGGTASYALNVETVLFPGRQLVKVCPTGALTASFTGNNQVLLNQNFSVSSNACANLSVEIKSDRRRRCFRNTTYVQYQNVGLTSSSPASTVKVILPKYVKAISSVPSWNSQSGDTLIYAVGSVGIFGAGTIKIIDSVICGDESIRGMTQCTQAIISPKNYCYTTSNWDQSDLYVTGECINSTFMAKIKNTGIDMVDSVSYRIFLDGEIVKTRKIKLVANAAISLELPLQGKALRIEVDQSEDHPEATQRSLNYEGCGNFATETISKGMLNQYPTHQGGSAMASDCQLILDSYDPNDKGAIPTGFGTDHKILADGELEYTIRFQNTGSDEAYTVVLADTLDANLDFASLRMIGASHPYKLEVTGRNSPRLVWIFGSINLPASSVDEPASHGFISFKISLKPGLAPGTVLKNKAYIYFDYNSAIITNQVTHMIGTEYPENTLKIITQPSAQQICATKQLLLASSGDGSGTVQYLWYKDGSLLSGATNASLSIANANISDGGTYKCRIENLIDTVYTNPVQVTVSAIPSLLVTDPEPSCSSVNITNTYSDENATTGSVSYWQDVNATVVLEMWPETIMESGTYYIKKETAQGCSDIEPVNVTTLLCTGTKMELYENDGFKIYPNPVMDKLIIEYKNAEDIALHDSKGTVVWNKYVSGEQISIDMKLFPSGIYALNIKANGQLYSFPLVKE